MMKDKKRTESAAKKPNNVVTVEGLKGQTREQVVATVTRVPEYQAAATIHVFEGGTGDLHSTILELQSQTDKINGGNMTRPESLLAAQAHTLDTLFNSLAQRSYSNMAAGYGEASERYMKLALRAQNQCRTTIEALSAIKNPPVVFAKQMNVSNGPQQINNGVATNTEPMAKDVTHTPENENEQNKLSGDGNELLADTRASQATCRINQTVETVGEIHRAENR